jgi:hypothetical protein
MPEIGYTGDIFESKMLIEIFDWMVLVTTVITVVTGIDYLIKNASILKAVLR